MSKSTVEDMLAKAVDRNIALQSDNKRLREKANAAIKKLDEYFIIYPRNRNKSDELVREAAETLKETP